MHLANSPFQLIKAGLKTVELRLMDEKRQGISIGDTIIFENREAEHDQFSVKIVDLYYAPTFEKLFTLFPIEKTGYEKADVLLRKLATFYTDGDNTDGVIGIEIELIK
jgi:ASC-1-like (ASCH) protein